MCRYEILNFMPSRAVKFDPSVAQQIAARSKIRACTAICTAAS
ncbi:hypothetical protein [uncultured Campylobacter sp.]|nr:hypothetical protein [uncultured Campylobacter sp.]